MQLKTPLRKSWPLVLLLCALWAVCADEVMLNGRVVISKEGSSGQLKDQSNAVVWLTPADGSTAVAHPPAKHPRLRQKGRTFYPHLLVVPVGTVVDFPNHDPVFHNVFSLFEGKRFDLGLYESGTSRAVHFNRAGVSYVFCNIHPEMTAIVIVLDTPYYGISDAAGQIVIPNVPDGRYILHAWYERSPSDSLKALTREITVSKSASFLGSLHFLEATNFSYAHKNKYGQEYETPTPSSPIYDQR